MKKRPFLTSLAAVAATAALVAVGLQSTTSVQAEEGSLKVYKFEADWCGPCQKMKPIFKKVSGQFSDVQFQTVNVDRNSSTANRFNVTMLPTLVAVKNGKEVGRTSGYKNAFQLKAFIKRHN